MKLIYENDIPTKAEADYHLVRCLSKSHKKRNPERTIIDNTELYYVRLAWHYADDGSMMNLFMRYVLRFGLMDFANSMYFTYTGKELKP